MRFSPVGAYRGRLFQVFARGVEQVCILVDAADLVLQLRRRGVDTDRGLEELDRGTGLALLVGDIGLQHEHVDIIRGDARRGLGVQRRRAVIARREQAARVKALRLQRLRIQRHRLFQVAVGVGVTFVFELDPTRLLVEFEGLGVMLDTLRQRLGGFLRLVDRDVGIGERHPGVDNLGAVLPGPGQAQHRLLVLAVLSRDLAEQVIALSLGCLLAGQLHGDALGLAVASQVEQCTRLAYRGVTRVGIHREHGFVVL